MHRLQKSEKRIGQLKKDDTKQFVVTGFNMNTNNEEIFKGTMENMINEELRIKTKLRKAFQIEEKRCVTEMEDWTEILKIPKEKVWLRGNYIRI